MDFVISLIYLLVKLVIIWGAVWVLDLILGMLGFIPVNIREILRRALIVVAVVLSLIAFAVWLTGSVGKIPGF